MPPVIRQGQFWWVNDEVVMFPEDRERSPHPSRGCVILEGNESLDRGGKRVQIIPTSSQTQYKEEYDVVISSPPLPGGAEYIALVQHLQPILRSDLKNLCVPLKDEWLNKILAAHLRSLGIDATEGESQAEEAFPF
jgi:hypothetical protein